ncbi:alpha-amylase family protein [Cohnella silvisoli]|uniref:Alpha-L-fucosidase n=1 Tax=Cohnella silvisoli TaxID=2873699 RepID=A0ABV1KWJ3_9BACL|nr:alpha-amylase family protein [Cohnella silvisoli]MCD9023764.1 alpha-L-fucosidase [Cohnella silvisoli]
MFDRKNAFFGLHFDLHPMAEDTSLGADVSEEMVERLLTKVRPEFVHYDCKGHPGYAGFPTQVGWASRGIVKDSLAIWRKATRRHGIGLGIHYSGIVDHLAVREHPEWASVDAEGKTDPEATSVFGPYVDELLIPQLAEVVDLYDIDSVWLDGECWGAKLDYSEAALAAWKQETGWDDAPKNRSDERWLAWKNFHRAHFERYLGHWTQALHELKPGVQVASNWAYTTMSPKPVETDVDYISGDFDPMLSVDRARTETRYLTNTGMPWELQAWGFDTAKDQEELLKTPVQLMQEAAVVLMHGGGFMVYFLPTRSGYISDEIMNVASETAQFCLMRKEISHRSTSVPQIALLHSSESQFDKSDRVYTWWDTPLIELEGALHALLESHYSVDVLSEHMLMDNLEKFPLLVIPDSHLLIESFRKRVLAYVADGGKLLLLGQRCAHQFQEALGVLFEGEPTKINAQLVSVQGKVGCPGKWQDVSLVTAEVLSMRYHGEGVHGRHSYLDVRSTGVSEEHLRQRHEAVAATIASYGKGEIAAVFGPVATCFHNSHHPFLRSYVRDIVARLFPDPIVTTDAPYCVDISIRRSSQGELCVHLMNLVNIPVSNRRAFVEYVPPIGPICVRILTDIRPANVMWEPDRTELKWEWEEGAVNVIVPSLSIHGVIVLKD